MTIIDEAPSPPASHDAEALFPETRRRRRRIRITFGVLVLVVAAAIAIPLGGHFFGHDRLGAGKPPIHRVSTAVWADARRTCDGPGLRAISANSSGKAHLYGAYPTTVRLAVNWPTKIYPVSGQQTPTTVSSGSHPVGHFDGWPPGLNSSQRATICIFTGNFVYKVPSMQGVYSDQRARVFLVYVGVIGSGFSITPANSIPRTPVPVA
ncbi:MAG TPA: hypothetical protein VND44_09525 [Acidimicrobiales bacterium]|nr:hypothetical protein [Acidimicrobiales bacterium]